MLVIVFIQEGERQNSGAIWPPGAGSAMMGAAGSHIPLKVNTAGMIPLIFAQALLVFPAIIASFFVNSTDANMQRFMHGVVTFFTAT